MKRVKEDLEGSRREAAILDLAAECMHLASLVHPNIVRLRGVAGIPGDDSFSIVMDRLYHTLEDQVETWRASILTKSSGCFSCRQNLGDSLTERLVTAYDTSRALNFLHERKVLYRDLKPSNLAFDVRGTIRLFDFGLAKELKKRDLVEGDLYR